MRKRTRILFFSLLTLAPMILLLNQNYGRALMLFVLLVMGALIFEKREASRQFFRALRKLLVCVDYDAFCLEGEKIHENAMLPWIARQHHQLFQLISHYHISASKDHKSVSEHHENAPGMGKHAFNTQEKALQFWAVSYMALIEGTRFNEQSLKDLDELYRQLPRYMKALAAERYRTYMLDLIDPTDRAQMDEAQRIRESLEAQLLLAEATYWLGCHTEDPKRAISYKKTAENLSKGLSIRRI